MKVTVLHQTTREEAIVIVDRSADQLFDFGSSSVLLTVQKKSWNGSVMEFLLVAKAGFIALPVSGTVTVDDANVIIECELPALARNFVGEDKIAASIAKRVSGLLRP